MNVLKKILGKIEEFADDKVNPEEPGYDPVHIGIMIVSVLAGLTVLFWLLWALLVFGGGIQSKLVPLVKLIFTGKTAADLGYVGYPYEMGPFEGWPTNIGALVLTIGLIVLIWHIFKRSEKKGR